MMKVYHRGSPIERIVSGAGKREAVKQMQAVIAYGEPKEIAALVAAIQERREMPCEAQRVYGVGQNRSIENEDGTMTLR